VTTDPARRVAVWTVVVGAVVFVGVAAWLVPWDPVPGGALSTTPADSVFTADQIERAEHYARWARVWSWSALVVSLAVAGWLAFSRRGRALFARLPGRWWVQVVLAVAIVEVVGRLATLPLSIAARQLSLDNGLSAGSWAAYVWDQMKGEAIAIVVTSLALLVLIGCARRWQRAWPAITGGLLGCLVLVGSFVYPVVVEPVFNDFESLPDGALRTEIFALADEEGVEIDDVLVADASRRTTTLNAYVSGFGNTRRVVVYDTLVETLPRDQALSVIAHELAHARHRDVVIGSVLGAAGAVLGVGVLALVLGALARRRLPSAAEPAVAPVVLALVALATLVTAPVQNGISRKIETRADVDALHATQDPQAFVGLQRKLALRSLADPTPPAWSHFWFGSHPTALTRMALAERVAGDSSRSQAPLRRGPSPPSPEADYQRATSRSSP
jgi:STE24 endopeptidase